MGDKTSSSKRLSFSRFSLGHYIGLNKRPRSLERSLDSNPQIIIGSHKSETKGVGTTQRF